jgi:hypothetical protein
MEQSPSWEANICSDGQEIHRILWNTKFEGLSPRLYKPATLIILSHINPDWTLQIGCYRT